MAYDLRIAGIPGACVKVFHSQSSAWDSFHLARTHPLRESNRTGEAVPLSVHNTLLAIPCTRPGVFLLSPRTGEHRTAPSGPAGKSPYPSSLAGAAKERCKEL